MFVLVEKKPPPRLEEHEDEDFEIPPIPVAPDGGIVPGAFVKPQSLPRKTPETMVCMRGPCRHYWYVKTLIDHGNAEGTFEALGIDEPRKSWHACLVNPGYESTFNAVYECNKWDPMTEAELVQIRTRREAYLRDNPEHAPEPDIEIEVEVVGGGEEE